MDKVVLQIEKDLLADERLVNFVKQNDEHTSKDFYEKEFKEKVVSRYEMNDRFFGKLFEDEGALQTVMDFIWKHIIDNLKK